MLEGHGTSSRSVVCLCVCVCVCVGWSPTEGSFFFSTLEIPSLNLVNFSVVVFLLFSFFIDRRLGQGICTISAFINIITCYASKIKLNAIMYRISYGKM